MSKRNIINMLFSPSKYSMKIFIDNWGFENRGDQLMIMSVVEQIKKYAPDAQILVLKRVFDQNHSYCIQNKLFPLQPKNSGIRNSKTYSWIVNLLLRDEWINTPRQVDLILNCRGYYIADCWIKNDDFVRSAEIFYKQFNKKGRRLIMLPQAFGPFENEPSKAMMNFICQQADKIYAREKQSFEYLSKVCPDTDKIEVVPDFTCVCHAENNPSIQLPKKNYVLIIPNARMIDKTSANVSDSYLLFLTQIIRDILKKGENVYLLNHEGKNDEQLLHIINDEFSGSLPILTNLMGTEIKALIKDCKLLISSRYHGVVSGLTQGVPTLCTSWSHKYEQLLKEHGCENNILDVNDISKSISIIEDALAHSSAYSSKGGCEEKIEYMVKKMWADVFE